METYLTARVLNYIYIQGSITIRWKVPDYVFFITEYWQLNGYSGRRFITQWDSQPFYLQIFSTSVRLNKKSMYYHTITCTWWCLPYALRNPTPQLNSQPQNLWVNSTSVKLNLHAARYFLKLLVPEDEIIFYRTLTAQWLVYRK